MAVPSVQTSYGAGLYGSFSPEDLQTWAGTPFVIEEATGADRIRLELRGSALPFPSMDMPTSRRVRTTRYPGVRAATQQVLGIDDGETEVEGRWDAAELASNDFALVSRGGAAPSRVESAEDLRELVYQLVERGQEISVQWAGIERRTADVSFTPQHDTRIRIRWSLRFVWGGRPRFVKLPVVDPLADSSASLYDRVSQIVDSLTVPAQVVQDLRSYASLQIQRVQALTSDLTDVVHAYVAGGAGLAETAAQAAGLLESTRAEARNLWDRIRITSVATAWTGSSGLAPTSFAVRLAIQQWLTETGRAALYLAGEAARRHRQVVNLVEPAIEAALQVQGDTDLRVIARQRWGSADGWTDIAAFNGLASSNVTAGTMLYIPRR